MTRIKRCGNSAHQDVVMRSRAGVPRVRCSACGDVFPCKRLDCGHLDCGWVRAGELPIGDFTSATRKAS